MRFICRQSCFTTTREKHTADIRRGLIMMTQCFACVLRFNGHVWQRTLSTFTKTLCPWETGGSINKISVSHYNQKQADIMTEINLRSFQLQNIPDNENMSDREDASVTHLNKETLNIPIEAHTLIAPNTEILEKPQQAHFFHKTLCQFVPAAGHERSELIRALKRFWHMSKRTPVQDLAAVLPQTPNIRLTTPSLNQTPCEWMDFY